MIDNYYCEIDNYGDVRVVRPYGPGFWEYNDKLAKEMCDQVIRTQQKELSLVN